MAAVVDAWARANKDLAVAALRIPPPCAVGALEDFEGYVTRRKFQLPPRAEDRRHALALLRHSLTYPLTLAAALAPLCEAKKKKTLRVAIVGARAESSLPLSVWAEAGVASERRWQLLMVGPQVAPSRRLGRPVSARDVSVVCRRASLTASDDLNALAREAFDDDDDDDDDLDEDLDEAPLDGVALFHPGLGHETLEAGWRGGLRSLVNARPRAVLVTSFSQADQRSDLAALDRFFADDDDDHAGGKRETPPFLVPPTLNPFRSGRPFIDPTTTDSTTLAVANERLFVLRGNGK